MAIAQAGGGFVPVAVEGGFALQPTGASRDWAQINIERGQQAMQKALDEKTTVHRAMQRPDLGWVDFEWGDAGRVKPSGKSEGAMGLAHILEARQRKDGLTQEQAVGLLGNLVQTIADGEVVRHNQEGKTQTVVVGGNGLEAVLTKRQGSNAWLLSGWEVKPPDAGRAGSVAPAATALTPTTAQHQGVAGGGAIVQPSAPEVNPPTPSQAMGIDPRTGPLSAAAAQALDSGAHHAMQAAGLARAPAASMGDGAQLPDGWSPGAGSQAAGGAGAGIVLQNRDRTSAASVAQMSAIAAQPDYWRTGPSRTMDQGAPVVFGDVPQGAVLGRSQDVADGHGERVAARYAVVDAPDVLTSHQANGSPVPAYAHGEAGKLRAVAGNGRAAGLHEAWRRGTAGQYRAELMADAPSLGLDAAAIGRMQRPMLVRVMDAADVKADIGDRSNTQSAARLSPVEEASNDARRINLSALAFDDAGNPTAQSVRGFIHAMPIAEHGNMLNPDGSPTRQAIDRLMAAAFKAAYGSDELVRLYAQATDTQARTVMTALADAAGSMAQLQGAGEFDVRQAVSEAAGMAINATRRGIKLADAVREGDMDMSPEAFVVAQFMAAHIRSGKRMADGLRRWAQLAQEQVRIVRDNASQGAMFGPRPTLSREQLFEGLGASGVERPAGNAQRQTPNGQTPDEQADNARRSQQAGESHEQNARAADRAEPYASGIPAGLPAERNAQSERLERGINADLRRHGGAGGFEALAVSQGQLPDALRSALEGFRRATGTRVVIFRNVRPDIEDFNGVNFRDGTVYINENSQHPVTLTAAHEWLHNLRRTDPDLYLQLALEVKRQGRLDAYQQKLKRDGERNWQDKDLVNEELTAAAVSDALTDVAFLERLAEQNEGVFVRVARAFLEFLDTLTAGWRNQGSNAYLQDVQAFRDKLARVLSQVDGVEGRASGVERPAGNAQRQTPNAQRTNAQRPTPNEQTLKQPTPADVLAQQERVAQAQRLDEREQIRRESVAGASQFALTQEDGRQDTTGMLFSRSAAAQPFFSALGAEVGASPTRSATAQGWASIIKGWVSSGKVKADEVYWSGLNEWLALQGGKISRQDVAGYINSNGFAVNAFENDHEWIGKSVSDSAMEAFAPNGELIVRLEKQPMELWKNEDVDLESKDEVLEYLKKQMQDGWEIRQQGEDGQEGTSLTLYDEDNDEVETVVLEECMPDMWRDDDGNYFDLLSEAQSAFDEAVYRYKEAHPQDDPASKYKAYSFNGDNYRELLITPANREFGYKSSHWGQKDVLAHVRLCDFTDDAGKKTLFVEELQSDWAQDKRSGKPVPDAPFVDTTDKWLTLTLKKVLLEAVDGGYERVSFITGEQSAERYSSRGEPRERGMRKFYDEIVPNALAHLLRKIDPDSNLGTSRIAGIAAHKRGGEGVQPGFDVTPVMREKLSGGMALFSRRAATQQAYEARIDALFAGDKANARGVRVLDKSDMLGLLGISNGPVHLVEGKVEQGRFNHGMSAADWKKVPQWLDDPAAVFDSDTQAARLVFIAPELVRGSPARMIIDPRADGGVNLLINAYDAERNPFERWARDGLLRYFDRQKATPVTGSFQPRLAGLPGERGRSKILTEKNLAGYRREQAAQQGRAAGVERGAAGVEGRALRVEPLAWSVERETPNAQRTNAQAAHAQLQEDWLFFRMEVAGGVRSQSPQRVLLAARDAIARVRARQSQSASAAERAILQGEMDQMMALQASVTAAMKRKDENRVLQRLLQKGPVPLARTLNQLSMATGDAGARALMRKLAEHVPPEASVQLGRTDGAMGRYSTRQKRVVLSPDARGILAGTLMHEAAHAATAHAMQADGRAMGKAQALLDYALAQDATMAAEYASLNAYEFVAEAMANPSLQAKLRAMPAMPKDAAQQQRSLWEQLLLWLQELLGLEAVHGDALAQTLSLADALMQANAKAASSAQGDVVLKHSVEGGAIDEAALLRALDSDDKYIRLAAAKNTSATEAVLLKALEGDDRFVRLAAAKNTSATEAVLLKALEGDDRFVRVAAAQNTSATDAVLLKAMEGDDQGVRLAAAKNTSATEAVLLKALEGDDRFVRGVAAKNTSATDAVLLKAMEDDDGYVRGVAAQNTSATEAVLLKALEGDDRFVKGAAAKNTSATDAVLLKAMEGGDPGVRLVAAQNTSATEAVLLKALEDGDRGVRLAAARNPRATEAVLLKAMEDADRAVYGAAANNPNVSSRLAQLALKKLQQDPQNNIRGIADLMRSGKIDAASIKDATIAGVMRWRRELRGVYEAVRAGETRIGALAQKTGLGKERLNVLLERSLGKELAQLWRSRDQIDAVVFAQKVDAPEYRMLAMMARGGVQSVGGQDHAISFFREDLADDFDALYKTQVASGHPPGFGFVLMRLFDGGKKALITEVQSDVMSVLFDKNKDEFARGLLGERLGEAREKLAAVRKTWPVALLRNAMRQLYERGVQTVYAITPEGLRSLGASPPESVVNSWAARAAAQAQGFGQQVALDIDGHTVQAWDGIDADSAAGQEIAFSRKTQDGPVAQAQLQREFDQAARASGGQAAYDQARAAAKTKLNYGQWVQVRTPRFKAWFGDWQAARSKDALQKMQAMPVAADDVLQHGDVALARQRAKALYAALKTATTTDGRVVSFPMARFKETMQHAADRRVLLVMPHLKEMLEHAVPLWQERSTVADKPNVRAFHHYGVKADLPDGEAYVRMVLREDNDGHVYYDNDATTVEALEAQKAPADERQPGRKPNAGEDSEGLSRNRLAQWWQGVNPKTVSQVIDPDTGEPQVVYHGSAHGGHTQFGRHAWHTAYGHFFTPERQVAQTYAGADKGDAQVYEVFLNAQNPLRLDLHVQEGRALPRWADAWAAGEFDGDYDLSDRLEGWEDEADIERMTGHSAQMSQWLSRPDDINTRGNGHAQDELMSAAEENGHDAVAFFDAGFGASTALSWVMFDGEAIKSATGNSGAFDGDNPDIRYSRSADGTAPKAQGHAPLALSGSVAAPASANALQLRVKTVQWAKARYSTDSGGKPATVRNTDPAFGKDVVVGWQGVKHAISGANQPELRMVPHIEEIVREAKLIASGPDKSARQDISAAHELAATVTLDGEALNVGVVVRQQKNGQYFYDQFIIKDAHPRARTSGAASSGELSDGLGGQSSGGGKAIVATDTDGSNTTLFSRSDANNAALWQAADNTALDDLIYKLQDKHVDTYRVQQAIEKVQGTLPDEVNVRQAEELYHNRSAERVGDFVRDEVGPLIELMRHEGLSIDDVQEYLHARHAPEANALIAQRDEAMPDGGSGMRNAQAAQYFAKLDAGQRAKLERVVPLSLGAAKSAFLLCLLRGGLAWAYHAAFCEPCRTCHDLYIQRPCRCRTHCFYAKRRCQGGRPDCRRGQSRSQIARFRARRRLLGVSVRFHFR